MTESAVPLNGQPHDLHITADIALPGEPIAPLPRPGEPQPSPFSASTMLRGVGYAS